MYTPYVVGSTIDEGKAAFEKRVSQGKIRRGVPADNLLHIIFYADKDGHIGDCPLPKRNRREWFRNYKRERSKKRRIDRTSSVSTQGTKRNAYDDGKNDAAYDDGENDAAYDDAAYDDGKNDAAYDDGEDDAAYDDGEDDAAYDDGEDDDGKNDAAYDVGKNDAAYDDAAYDDGKNDAAYDDGKNDAAYDDGEDDAAYDDGEDNTRKEIDDSKDNVMAMEGSEEDEERVRVYNWNLDEDSDLDKDSEDDVGSDEDDDERKPEREHACICGNEDSEKDMVQCDNSKCYNWHHYKCVGYERKHKGKWYCYKHA